MVVANPTSQARFKGNVSGHVAVGHHTLQIGGIYGSIVNHSVPAAPPKVAARERPVRLMPRPFPTLLDREDETKTIQSALAVFAPVSLFGAGGAGKTSLLRRVAHLPGLQEFTDGIVYLDVKGKGLDDLCQLLYDVFYSSPPNTKQTEGEIRHGLQNIKALILLDDLMLEPEAAESLLNILPGSVFVLASSKSLLWGEGAQVELMGLPEQDARLLFERGLGRTLLEPETAVVKEIIAALEAHPMRIIQVASALRKSGRTLRETREQLYAGTPDVSAVQVSLSGLSETQKKILCLLGAAGGARVPRPHLSALLSENDLQAALNELLSLGLVQSQDSRYSVTAAANAGLPNIWDLSDWEELLIRYFSQWVMQQLSAQVMEASSEILMEVLRKASARRRWKQVARIGRALEPYLILWKRWQAWADLADQILTAARGMQDPRLEAWVFHQMGTRAQCLGYSEQARELLTKALSMRQEIGDRPGIEVTRHNLDVLNNLPIPPKTKIKKGGSSGGWPGLIMTGVVLAALIGAGGALASSPLIAPFFATASPTEDLPARPEITPTPVTSLASSPTSTVPASTDTPSIPILSETSPPTQTVPAVEMTLVPSTSEPDPLPTTVPFTATATLFEPAPLIASLTPTPTDTPEQKVTALPCHRASLESDVTYPDGTSVDPGASFTKIWQLTNVGTCTWTSNYQIVFTGGDVMSRAREVARFARAVAPGQRVEVSADLIAPREPGTYQSNFMILAPDGTLFGVGPQNTAFWVRIVVPSIRKEVPVETRDTVGPKPPRAVEPKSSSRIDCISTPSVFLVWDKTDDPSGIQQYELLVEISENGSDWRTIRSETWQTRDLRHEIKLACPYSYRWTVRAQDGAQNWGEFGEYQYFHVVQALEAIR